MDHYCAILDCSPSCWGLNKPKQCNSLKEKAEGLWGNGTNRGAQIPNLGTVEIVITHRVKMHIFEIAYSSGGNGARLVGFSIEIA